MDIAIIVGAILLGMFSLLLISRRARRRSRPPQYTLPFHLYCEDATRGVEIRLRRDGSAYFVELERVEGSTFRPRGPEVGPFEGEKAAEAAAVNRPWFATGTDTA